MGFKKVLLIIPTILMLSPTLFSCSQKDPNVTYLRVLNSEDYIDPTIITEFENQARDVIYETIDTMENMFNTLKTGKTKYDLVCASDYMVQKLVNLNLLEKIDYNQLSTYENNSSKFIRDRLEDIKWGEDDKYNLHDYCACYMWGTLGILYNPNYYLLKERGIKDEQEVINDMKTFDSLWLKKYQKVIAIKDSMRDTYAIGLIHSYKDKLDEAKGDEEKRQMIFDYGGEHDSVAKEHIKTIQKNLINLRNNIFGFEVDSGKEDIVTEKIGIDTAWSGDAVKAIHNAEVDKNLMLYYTIPEEGSNLWFDCWTIQKGAKVDLAYKFLNFLFTPENAIKNMNEIGYTSSIATSEIKDYFQEKYKPDSENTAVNYDTSYFFNDGSTLSIDEKYVGRQMSAQFPTGIESKSLMVMKDYGKNNDLILKMWEQVKHEALPAWAIALFVVEIALVATAITVIITVRIRNKNRRKERRIRRA